jgi:excisionase family DNA binding protein
MGGDVMSALGVALIGELDDAALEALIARLPDSALDALAQRLASRLTVGAPDRWLSTHEAAAYLGITANALHKLTARRAIEFEQAKPGAKCWFRKSDLDAWRRATA